jgi:hypothetical protein
LGDKIEETVLDATGNKLKTFVYTYDAKGLKVERKTLDANGKIIAVRKYQYEK